MWPMLLDLSRDESKRVLRRMELEAYSSIITAFRAQGDLTKEKKSMLQDLQNVLSISTERHRAEVRRAVNDEKLATVADNIAGSNTTSEWMIEGRRLVPLMPRLVPQTAFTATANQAAHLQAEKNLTLPTPAFTGNKDVNNVTVISTSTSTSTPTASRPSRPNSPVSNIVVLPSGASIHIKGCLNPDDDEELHTRKRRRSLSSDSLSSSIGTQTPRLTYPTTTSTAVPSMSPVKITISKSPQGRTIVSTPGSQPPKVILVTTSGQTPGHNVFHKSMSVPVVRATTSMSQGTGTARAPIMVPSSSPVSSGASLSNIFTVTTTSLTSSMTSPVTAPTSVLGSPPAMVINSALPKPRPKIIPRQRLPQPIPSQKPGVVIPMTPQPVQPSPQSYQIKTINKPTIQIKQEGGMKIITQSLPAGTSKILPKPVHLSSNSGTPVVVVNAGPSGTSTSTVSMVTKPVTSLSANKVLNISTPGGRVIATTSKASSVVTVNPKTLHLTAVKTGAGTTVSKPNVIVVQKTQSRRSSTPTHAGSGSTQVISHPSLFEKELANFIQKQDLGKNVSVSVTSSSSLGSTLGKIGDRKVIITTQTSGDTAKQVSAPLLQRSRSEQEGKTSSLLAELIQAAGIVPEAAAETSVPGTGSANEWFEYDVTDDQGQTVVTTTEDSTAIDALLQMQAADAAGKVKESSLASAQLERLQGQQSETQYYTIDQAMSLLNQSEKDTSTTDTPTEPPSEVVLKPATEQPQIHIIKTSVPGSKLSSEHIQHIRVPLPASRQAVVPSRTLDVAKSQNAASQELDPQTGLFYASGGRKPRKSTIIVGLPPKVVTSSVVAVVNPKPAVVTPPSQNVDLLSSSLAQAQIELDKFDYLQGATATVSQSDSQTGDSVKEDNSEKESAVELSVNTATEGDGTADEVSVTSDEVVLSSQTTDVSDDTTTHSPSTSATTTPVPVHPATTTPVPVHPATTTPVPAHPATSFIPLSEVTSSDSKSTINIITHPQSSMPTEMLETSKVDESNVSSENVVVTMEPVVEAITLRSEEFTSQQMEEKDLICRESPDEKLFLNKMDIASEEVTSGSSPPTGNSSDSQGEGSLGDSGRDMSSLLRLSSRKRKQVVEEPAHISTMGGWVRAALGLTQKVSKFRGANRDKGDLNAAAWFIQPVDPVDAPNYYSVVTSPMDFGTIKKKVEGGDYKSFEDYHADMLLVQNNCNLYNHPQSKVRRDCGEVFAFYEQERTKVLDKLQKGLTSSPVTKKFRVEKSPAKS